VDPSIFESQQIQFKRSYKFKIAYLVNKKKSKIQKVTNYCREALLRIRSIGINNKGFQERKFIAMKAGCSMERTTINNGINNRPGRQGTS
jgi:hypothetical protein